MNSSPTPYWKSLGACAGAVVDKIRRQRDGLADPDAEISTIGDASVAFAKLRELGVNDKTLFACTGIYGAASYAPVRAEPHNLFSFDESGTPAIILAARDEWHEIADLVAWYPDRPDVWRRRTGASKFLGAYALAEAAFFHRSIKIFASPLSWLRAGCAGAVVLDPSADLRADFDGIPKIQAETFELARSIDRQLTARTFSWKPKITVPE